MKVINTNSIPSRESTVYVIQEIAGTKAGNPKINIMGASHYGKFVFLLPEFSQMIFSPGPLVYKLMDQAKKSFVKILVIKKQIYHNAKHP